jgi:hypothetical protein
MQVKSGFSFPTQGVGSRDVLKYLYISTSALCAFMVVWILFAPASWLGGRSKLHDDMLLKHFNAHSLAPPEIIRKYAGHSAVHITHTLPGAIWAGLIPFQLNPVFRKTRPRVHRICGYAFIASSLLMTLGIAIILKRGLLFERFFDDLPPREQPTELWLVGLAIYFAGTAMYALKCAMERRFLSHQRWIIRHVAAGMWVALQRVLIVVVYPAIYRPPVAREVQRQVFGEAASIATVVSLAMGEYSLYLLGKQKEEKRID